MLNHTQKQQYITGIDGLRAFAVLAVVAYHFSLSWAGGGFLGVDMFFVISGYLITSRSISQFESEEYFSLKEFWVGRARRLIPAVYVMIIVTFILVALFNRKLVTTILGDGLSSIVYASNWWFIFHKLSYFDSFGSPSPLKNLWSLAIEEQFYIVWPLVLITGLKIFKKRVKLANIVFLAALCSAVLMAILYKPGQDPSRVYYGTDTRAFELLIGGWLAIICPMNKFLSIKKSEKQKKALNIVGTIALAVFVLSVIFMKVGQSSVDKNINKVTGDEKRANTSSEGRYYDKMLAIGDSIMLDIAPELRKRYTNITIDGKVGRQLYQAISLAPAYSAFNAPNKAVIIELGTNAYFTDQQIDSLLSSFSKAHIYLVNVLVPRQWEKEVIKALARKANEYENVTLIDWYSAAISHPEYFASDGVHLQSKGAEALTSLMDRTLTGAGN